MLSCSASRLQRDVMCLLFRHRRQNAAFSADVVDGKADVSLAFELGNRSAMTGTGVIDDDRVGERDVDSSLMADCCQPLRLCLVVYIPMVTAPLSSSIQVHC